MPESYRNINFQELHPLKEKYPKVYKKVQKRLETGWEPTLKLLEQGKEEGIIRKDADLKIFKIMMEASLERFFEKDVMKGSGKKYNDYLNEIVDILLNGIKQKGRRIKWKSQKSYSANVQPGSVYKKAEKSKKKYTKKFGDDSEANYSAEVVENPYIGDILGVKNIAVGDSDAPEHPKALIPTRE